MALRGSGSWIALFLVVVVAIFAGVFYGLDRAGRVGSTSSPGPGSTSGSGERPSPSSSSRLGAGAGRKSASGAHVIWGICAADIVAWLKKIRPKCSRSGNTSSWRGKKAPPESTR